MPTPNPNCRQFNQGLEAVVKRARALDGFEPIHVELERLFRGDPEDLWHGAQPLYQRMAEIPDSQLDESCRGLKRLMERMLQLGTTSSQARANLRVTIKELVDTTVFSNPEARGELLQLIARADDEGVEGLDTLLNALRGKYNFQGTDYALLFGQRRGGGMRNVRAVEVDRGTGSGRGVDMEFKDADPADAYAPKHFEFKSGPTTDIKVQQSMLHLFLVDEWKRYRIVLNTPPNSSHMNRQASKLLTGGSSKPAGALPAGTPPDLHLGILEMMRNHPNDDPWKGMLADLRAHTGTNVSPGQLTEPFLDATGAVLDETSTHGKVLEWARMRFFESFEIDLHTRFVPNPPIGP